MMQVAGLHLEIAMLMTDLKRLVSWFTRPHHAAEACVEAASKRQASVLDFDPAWHGDHWQNLLSSPMDARHYVMEDWTTTVTPAFEGAASTGVRRAHRRTH
ncbi:hypothetical protein [Trinickia mobilis]|uniref:hypothetical protein n=1 Tax=Trinickia mobilis TaxID=2816356 RepID=UPI001F5D8646|nr:hypothetical protein [Trinickia mobilis]